MEDRDVWPVIVARGDSTRWIMSPWTYPVAFYFSIHNRMIFYPHRSNRGSKEERWGRKKDGEIRKKDEEVRYTADYQHLNVKTIEDVFPLPLIKECIDTLADNLWFHFHTPHLVSGYWQIIRWHFLPNMVSLNISEGLCSAPATFQRVMRYKLCNVS